MKYLIFMSSILLSCIAIGEPITSVDIYAPCGKTIDTNYPYDIKVHYIGCQEALSTKLSSQIRNLKDNNKAIKEQVREYIDSHKEEVQKSFNNELQSTNSNVKRFPAVVMNNKYVIYGTDDFSTAKAKYYEYVG
jgi:hypothetical protein